MSKFTKEQIRENVINELDEALENMGGMFDGAVIDVDIDNKTVTVVFELNIDEDENYAGLHFNI